MNCKYSSYSDKTDNFGRNYLYCSVTHDNCPLVRYCNKVMAFINEDLYEDCRYYNMENEKVTDGFSKVRFEKRGKLYVEVDNQVVTFDNPYREVPKEVKIVKVDGVLYIQGTEPKQETKTKPRKKDLDEIEKELNS